MSANYTFEIPVLTNVYFDTDGKIHKTAREARLANARLLLADAHNNCCAYNEVDFDLFLSLITSDPALISALEYLNPNQPNV